MATEALILNEGLETGMKVQVSKVIRARRAKVYEAWTKPEVIQNWFGPGHMVTSEATVDLRVGGEYRFEMTPKDGGPMTTVASGVYTEIVPDELLQFTWNGTWRPGEETLVTVSLKDATGGTEVTVVHERFQTMESAKGHEAGWMAGIANMTRVLEG